VRSLSITLALLCVAPVCGEEALTVLRPDADPPPRKMLHAFLMARCREHFAARKKTVAALKDPAEIRKRQETLKAAFIRALGGFPEKTPLRARTVRREDRGDHILERVIYESRPDHHVTAHLYLPPGKGPFPGVLLPCGHSLSGKAAPWYQQACILLARNGLAALCYDPIGQGERIQLLEAGKPATRGSTTEHTLTGVGALLVGRSTATYRIWDGIRSLDYLASRPEIDPKRLGCTGVSGGGTLTSYLMALDERIVAAAPSCYITSLERLFETIGPQDAEQNITGQVAFGMDHADYVTMRAPRPTLLLAATRDFFNIDGTWDSFREAKLLYGKLGHSDRVAIAEFDTKHSYPRPQREAMVRWMRRWLLGKAGDVSEGEIPTRPQRELWCTRSGQVLEDLKGKSVFALNAERARELAAARERDRKGLPAKEFLAGVTAQIGVPWKDIPAAKMREAGMIEKEGYTIHKRIYETEPGIAVPALLYLPSGKPTSLVVRVHGEGMAADGAAAEKLVRAGQAVLTLDLRGFGETAPGKAPAGRPGTFGVDFKEAFLALHLNRPLLGQRTFDLLAVLAHAAGNGPTKGLPVHLVGIGKAGPVALHAAALDGRIGEVTLERAVVSWDAVVRTPLTRDQLTNVVPGALARYDLPDLAASLAPRPLTIRSATDPAGKVLPEGEVRRAYKRCREEYARRKAADRLRIRAE
jgi:dienelactone hydrolase